AAVALGGVRARALVQDGFDAAQTPVGDQAAELVLVQVIGNAAIDQVDELVALGQVIDRNDVGDAAAVQAAHQIASYEAGCAGDDDHGNNSPAPHAACSVMTILLL